MLWFILILAYIVIGTALFISNIKEAMEKKRAIRAETEPIKATIIEKRRKVMSTTALFETEDGNRILRPCVGFARDSPVCIYVGYPIPVIPGILRAYLNLLLYRGILLIVGAVPCVYDGVIPLAVCVFRSSLLHGRLLHALNPST